MSSVASAQTVTLRHIVPGAVATLDDCVLSFLFPQFPPNIAQQEDKFSRGTPIDITMSSANVVEVPPADIAVQDGYVGNLTDEQHNALVKMWQAYFDICDRARGQASKGSGFTEDKTGSDLKKSGIPTDDAAKDEAKKMQEQQGMNDLMDQYGPEALRDSWWNFVRQDSPDGNMLRFVRARKGDVGRGISMMATCLKWRLDNDVEGLIASGDLNNGKQIPKFTDQQKSGKVFSLGCTAKEQPICYVIMKHHK